MAGILISLSGDGRGHATRMRTVVESLRREHQITLYTSGEAFDFLSRVYEETEVRVVRIPGLRLGYTDRGSVDYRRTFLPVFRYLRQLPRLIASLELAVEKEGPDLVITDFEPALPRAARRQQVPFVSLNHQYFLVTYDLSSLPRWLRWHAAYMGLVVKAYHSGQVSTVVSSFYRPPLRQGVREVTQVGVLLRQEVVRAVPEYRGHVTAYFRRHALPPVFAALEALQRPVRVYGLGQRPSVGKVEFRPVSEAGFLEDLATGDALISTAGNQLVGEALYLGKPVFALPEPQNYEQYMNAHFLAQGQSGKWSEMARVTASQLRLFLQELEEYKANIDRRQLNGLPDTLAVIRKWLPGKPASRSSNPSAAAVMAPVPHCEAYTKRA